MISMILATKLASVTLASLAPTASDQGWALTSDWLREHDQIELALESLLMEPCKTQEEKGEIALEVIALLRAAPVQADFARRVRLDLDLRVAELEGLDRLRVRLGLLEMDRRDALHGEVNRPKLEGVLREVELVHFDVADRLREVGASESRRWLESLDRRTALLQGLLHDDLGRSHETAGIHLRRAMLGDDEQVPDPLHAQMLRGSDGLEAAAALAKVSVRSGDLSLAGRLVDMLVAAHWPVHDASAIRSLLEALDESQRAAALSRWGSALPDGLLLELADLIPQGSPLSSRLHDRGLQDQLIQRLAKMDGAVPDVDWLIEARVLAERARRGHGDWATALEALNQPGQLPHDGARIDLGEALHQTGDHAGALAVLMSVAPGPDRARSDNLIYLALRAQVDAGELSAGVMEPVLRRICSRGEDAPMAISAALQLASLPSTSPQEAIALIERVPPGHALEGTGASLLEQVVWPHRDQGPSGARRVVHAARAVLELDLAQAPEAAGRLLDYLPKAQLSPPVTSALAKRAIDVIASSKGSAIAQAHAGAFHARQGDVAKATGAVLEAWRGGDRSSLLEQTTSALLQSADPLGERSTELASYLLGRSPMLMRKAELTPAQRRVLVHWARHMLQAQAMSSELLEHAAGLDVLQAAGLVQLARRAGEQARWPLAVDAWRRAAQLDEASSGRWSLEQARALSHFDSASAIQLARQLAVLHVNDPVGQEAKVLADQLEAKTP
ncbi:MAG: hypothetical protein MK101_07850 [Phycisphaerales bacterium]|nr:hypothetical protein [Phycisphaerales bacterium]